MMIENNVRHINCQASEDDTYDCGFDVGTENLQNDGKWDGDFVHYEGGIKSFKLDNGSVYFDDQELDAVFPNGRRCDMEDDHLYCTFYSGS